MLGIVVVQTELRPGGHPLGPVQGPEMPRINRLARTDAPACPLLTLFCLPNPKCTFGIWPLCWGAYRGLPSCGDDYEQVCALVHTGKSASCMHKSGAAISVGIEKLRRLGGRIKHWRSPKGQKESEQKPRLSRIGWSNGRCRPETGACAHNNACSA